MQSIRTRITLLAVAAILVVIALAGTISVVSFRYQEDVGSEQLMGLICQTSGDHINERLETIEQSVNAVAVYVSDSLDTLKLAEGDVIGATGSGISLKGHDFSSERQRDFDEYLSSHIKGVQPVFASLAAQTEGVLGYYYRINPEISVREKGFLYSRIGGGAYVYREPTDLSAYQSNDYAHVGWYYLPQESGRSVWVSPYFDVNQQIEVISFIAPLYKAGTFIGVVGMDIPYDVLVEQIEDLEIMSSGYAFLTDAHSNIVYHPTLPRQTSLGDVNVELNATEAAVGSLAHVTYDADGIEKKAAWTTLRNGMRLFVCAPVSEINAGWYMPTTIVVGVSFIVIVALIVMVALGTRRITKPLEELTVAAQQLSEGNYDITLPYEGNDEVGILTNSFKHLVEALKSRISFLYDRAYKDGLTNVRNKAAFDAYAAEIDESLNKGELREGFAVVACDCNELKLINDTLGHDKGDEYLKNSCRVICEVYDHSPVFRVGGDEFICILTDRDFGRRDELAKKFWQRMDSEAQKEGDAWCKVNLAMGMAVYDPQTDRALIDVMRRADDLMYQNKNEFKMRRVRLDESDLR